MSAPHPNAKTLDAAIRIELSPCPFCQSRKLLAFSGGRIGVFIECGNCLARGPTAQNWAWARRKWNNQALAA